MNIDQETSEKIQELQIIEQSLQSSMTEKQNLQIELNEISNALQELKNNPEEVYKIAGGIMLKSNKELLTKELNDRKNTLDMKFKAIDKQENLVEEKANSLRKEINTSLSKKK